MRAIGDLRKDGSPQFVERDLYNSKRGMYLTRLILNLIKILMVETIIECIIRGSGGQANQQAQK